jgi:choline dehydrogenase-like flavoprotein
MNSTHYDVIIIGTGAGGGTLAHRLAPSGKRILILERGDYVPREKDNWSARAVNVLAKYNTKEQWYDDGGKPLHPHTNYNVGGNTKFYGAALFRLRREDFGELRHHGGISPAWPIDYEDLALYYDEAEGLYQVHGERGIDPTDPPSSGPYPFPAISHEPRIQQLHDDLVRLGHRPFHVPLGVMLDERDPLRSRCIRCETCDGHPCLVHAKADAEVICVAPALRHPGVALRPVRAYPASKRRHRAARLRRLSWTGAGSPSDIRPTSSSWPAARSIQRRCSCGPRTSGILVDSPTPRMSSDGIIWGTPTRC